MYCKSLNQFQYQLSEENKAKYYYIFDASGASAGTERPHDFQSVLSLFDLYSLETADNGNSGPTSILLHEDFCSNIKDYQPTQQRKMELRQKASQFARAKNYKDWLPIAEDEYKPFVEDLYFFAAVYQKVIICICDVYDTVHVMLLHADGYDYLYSSVDQSEEYSVFGSLLKCKTELMDAVAPYTIQKLTIEAYQNPIILVLKDSHYTPAVPIPHCVVTRDLEEDSGK